MRFRPQLTHQQGVTYDSTQFRGTSFRFQQARRYLLWLQSRMAGIWRITFDVLQVQWFVAWNRNGLNHKPRKQMMRTKAHIQKMSSTPNCWTAIDAIYHHAPTANAWRLRCCLCCFVDLGDACLYLSDVVVARSDTRAVRATNYKKIESLQRGLEAWFDICECKYVRARRLEAFRCHPSELE